MKEYTQFGSDFINLLAMVLDVELSDFEGHLGRWVLVVQKGYPISAVEDWSEVNNPADVKSELELIPEAEIVPEKTVEGEKNVRLDSILF